MNDSSKDGLYLLPQWCFMLIIVDYDLDLDLYAIWHKSSSIPTPPPYLAINPDDPRQILNKVDPIGYEAQGPSLIECLFYPNRDKLLAFKQTGLDPLSISTQASDIFLYILALLFPKEVHLIEFRFTLFNRISSDTIGEDLIFLPRVETALGNLYRVRRQLLEIITQYAISVIGTSFRLSLQPYIESLLYLSLSIYSPLTILPPTLSLDPRFFMHNISGNYR